MDGRLALLNYIPGHALQVRAVQFEDGRVPFFEFFDSLERRDQAAVLQRLRLIAAADWQWLRSNSRSVGSGVYEMRQPRHLRVFWVRHGEAVVVLLGGVKKNVGPRGQSAAIAAAVGLATRLRADS